MYKYRRGTSPTKRSVSTTTLSIQHGNLFILYYFFSLSVSISVVLLIFYMFAIVWYIRVYADDARNLPHEPHQFGREICEEISSTVCRCDDDDDGIVAAAE